MAVKRILTAKASVGMTLAEDIYTTDDTLLVSAGSVITEEMLNAFNDYSIFAIRIQEGEEPSGDDADREERTYFDQVRESEVFQEFQHSVETTAEHLQEELNAVIVHSKAIDMEFLISDMNAIISKSRNEFHILDMLHCMRGYSDTTYIHSINVALLSNTLGRLSMQEMSEERLNLLTMAGLLHDVGKMMIPEEIMGKRGRLTIPEYNIAKSHTLHGQTILKQAGMPEEIVEVALRHHERCDGSGYPGGYMWPRISEFARIVAIADVYDAMTSRRVYRDAICPFKVIEYFEKDSLAQFEPTYLIKFLDVVAQSFLGVQVRLNNGRTGKVVMINRQDLSRPVVQLDNDFLDLSRERALEIVQV